MRIYPIPIRTLLLIPCLMVLTSCASAPGYFGPDIIPTDRTHAVHRHHGFRVRPPLGPGWQVRISEQQDELAIYRREFESKTHSMLAQVRLKRLSRIASSHDEFLEVARPLPIEDAEGFEFVEFSEERTTFQGYWAFRYSASLVRRDDPDAEGREVTMRNEGCMVRHPTLPATAVHIVLSERGLEEELDSEFETVAKRFFAAVLIDSASAVPAR